MCRVLKTSKGGFHVWLTRSESERKRRDQALRTVTNGPVVYQRLM